MRHLSSRILLGSSIALLAACGGGGSGGGGAGAPTGFAPPPVNQSSSPSPAYLSGIAATGAPLAGAAVTAQCTSGAMLQGTTDTRGDWSLELASQAFPCLVTVSGGALPVGQSLYSVALDKDSALNVTPLTTLVTAGAAQALPASLGTDAAALAAAAKALGTGLARANASLAAAGYTTVDGNPLVDAFKPQAGDAHDDLIELLMRSLQDENLDLATLAERFATNGDAQVPVPYTHVFSTGELAAMPQLNQASLVAEAGVLKMKVEAGLGAVGSFVGSGRGNKAVLQLPGLAGTKLSELKDITMQISGQPTTTYGGITKNVYTYMNFTVDLDCSAAPLNMATATLADVRARHRIFIYDPFYNFVQLQPNAISPTEISSINVTPATMGWRVSGGADVGVTSTDHNTGTLTGFNHAAYPNACIVDSVSADNGMFRDSAAAGPCATDANGALLAGDPATCARPYRGAIVVLGDSGTDVPVEWKVKKVRVNGKSPRNFVFE